MIRTGFIVLSMMFAASTASTAQTADKYHKLSEGYVVKALEAMGSGDAKQAQSLYERALVANPANAFAMVGLGKAHAEQGRTGRGLKYYRFALEVTPNYKPALAEQSLAFIRKGNIDRATTNQMILTRLCSKGCAELTAVNNAIDDFRANPPEVKLLEDKSEGQ